MRRGDSFVEELKEEHTAKMDEINTKLAASIERSSLQWKSERSQLEEHHNSMMSENLNRQRVIVYVGSADGTPLLNVGVYETLARWFYAVLCIDR